MKLRRSWIRVAGFFAGAGLTAGAMLLAGSYLYLAPGLPPASELRTVEFQIPLRIYSAEGSLVGEFGEQRRSPITYEQLPPMFVKAVLAAEDERFFKHGGVDIAGLVRASLELIRYQEIRSGGSTITMQVARNFFLSRAQRFLRKFNEIVLAIQIENLLSKEEILELYLNKIYLGHRAYGAEAAAQVYYGRSIDELTLPQWAMIAGLPKAPSAYNPITNPERARQRRNWILEQMHDGGVISEEELTNARESEIAAEYHGPTPDLEASYFAEMVRQRVVEKMGEQAYTRGLRVYTTLEDGRQKSAVEALREGLHEYNERHGWRGPVDKLEVTELPPLKDGGEGDEKETPESTSGADSAADEANAAGDEKGERTPPEEQWAERLDDYPTVGRLRPALVAEVTREDALLVLPDATRVRLPMKQMEWARPYQDTNSRGEAPETPGDVLAVGDVVRLRPLGGETADKPAGWRLAQVPEAQGALVSLDPDTGAVRALQGGYSFGTSKYNRATQSQRQVGSAFKPFIYTAALENGFTPATMVNDAPIVFEDKALETVWRPTGAGSRFYGPTRLREGLYRSLNLVSIRVLKQMGVSNALETLEGLGLPTERFPRDLSLALGSASLTPMELATAYCLFANTGYRVEPWFIERIDNNEGDTIWHAPGRMLCEEDGCQLTYAGPSADQERKPEQNQDPEQEPGEGKNREQVQEPEPGYNQEADQVFPLVPVVHERVLDARTAWLMHSMLRDVVRRGTGRRARSLGRPDIAGKTGTTNEQVDAWFSGYMPALVATTWVGFDAPASLGYGEYGGRAALPIWMDYMKDALQGVPIQEHPQPGGIVSVRINPENGKRARPGNDKAIFEFFREGNLPEKEPPRGGDGNDSGESEPRHLF